MKNVKIQCNDLKINESKPSYIYELLIKCKNIHQIQELKNNILKSSMILNEKISKSIEAIDDERYLCKTSHHKCELVDYKDFKRWKEKIEFNNIHVDSSKYYNLNDCCLNEFNHSHLIYKLVLECYEPLQIELIDHALFEDTIIICSEIRLKKLKCLNANHISKLNKKKINLHDIKFEEHTDKSIKSMYPIQYDANMAHTNFFVSNTNRSKDIMHQKSCITKNSEGDNKVEFFDENCCKRLDNKKNKRESIHACECEKSKYYNNEYSKRLLSQKPKKSIKLQTDEEFVNKLYENIIKNSHHKFKELINTSIFHKSDVEDYFEPLKSNYGNKQILKNYKTLLRPSNEISDSFKSSESISTSLLSNDNEYLDKNKDLIDKMSKITTLKNDISPPSNFDKHNHTKVIRENTLSNPCDFKETNNKSFIQCHDVEPQSFKSSEVNSSILNEKTCDLHVSNKYSNIMNSTKSNCKITVSNINNSETSIIDNNVLWIHKNNDFIENPSKLEASNMSNCNKKKNTSTNFNPQFHNKTYDDIDNNQIDTLTLFDSNVEEKVNMSNKFCSNESYAINNYRSHLLALKLCQKDFVDSNANDSIENMHFSQNIENPTDLLEPQCPIEIVVQQPSIEYEDNKYQIDSNKEAITLQNDKTLYNNLFKNHCTVSIEKDNPNFFNQSETIKNELQKHKTNSNLNEYMISLNPKLLEVIIDHPPIKEQDSTINPWIQCHQISDDDDRFYNQYGNICMVGKEIQTDLSGPPEDENIFCKLDGYVCFKDKEIICKRKKKRKKYFNSYH